MEISDVVQTVSFVAAVIALLVSLRQNREMARQTASALISLRQTTHQELVRYGADFTFEALAGDPELLAWFLAGRGFPSAGELENRKSLFLWVRLDMHEANYHAFRTGATTESVWLAWLPTMKLDFALPEFPRVWQAVREVFSADFAALVDRSISEARE
jgi:hypothetical protein